MTEHEKLKCAERELAMRKRVYPRLVDAGKLKPEQATYELECMRAIVDDYNKIVNGERLI